MWYTKAAEQGDQKAQYYLGEMYQDGKGVKKNGNKALEWWEKSARQGYSPALERVKERQDQVKRETGQEVTNCQLFS